MSSQSFLDVGGPEGLEHLVGGEGAGGVAPPADDLALGGQAKLSSHVVFSLGRVDIDLLQSLAVTANGPLVLLGY